MDPQNNETPEPRPAVYGRPPELDQLVNDESNISSQQVEIDPNEAKENQDQENQNQSQDEPRLGGVLRQSTSRYESR